MSFFGLVTRVGMVLFLLHIAVYVSLSTVRAEGFLTLLVEMCSLLEMCSSGLVNWGGVLFFGNSPGLLGTSCGVNFSIQCLYLEDPGIGIFLLSSLEVIVLHDLGWC